MADYNHNMHFDAPWSYSPLRTSVQYSFPESLSSQSQYPVMQGYQQSIQSFSKGMDFIPRELHSISSIQMSFTSLDTQNKSSLASSGASNHRALLPDLQNRTFFQENESRPTNSSAQQKVTNIPTRKRAPKAPTMSAERWRPFEGRIRQLWVHESCSLEDLKKTVNNEFGITATRRQYLAQIEHMKIGRNVKAKEREKIVRHVHDRVHKAGKKSSLVRVRGHKISQEKLNRWAKEVATDQPGPLSPLLSCISLYTNSFCGSPKPIPPYVSNHQISNILPLRPKEKRSLLQERLLAYAQSSESTIQSQEARGILNDIQTVLSADRAICRKHGGQWDTKLENSITRLRNLMNMDINQRVAVTREPSRIQTNLTTPSKNNFQPNFTKANYASASWKTPYGSVTAIFGTTSNISSIETTGQTGFNSNEEPLASRILWAPRGGARRNPFRVLFDIAPNIANITYQAIIPNDSEVFKIAASGEVRELVSLVENGSASLADRNEQGQSLLSHAVSNANVKICKFLVDNHADIDSLEDDGFGNIGPVSGFHSSGNHSEMDDIERCRDEECLKIVLEAGADSSLLGHYGYGRYRNIFEDAIFGWTVASLRHLLDFGEPFINSRSICTYNHLEGSPLLIIADWCGYDTAELLDLAEKAILLLERKADIYSRDKFSGDTVLHLLLTNERYHEMGKVCYTHGDEIIRRQHILSMTEPKEILIIFIAAGADVYAKNNDGETPSMVAEDHGRAEEWIEALEYCGYDAEEVLKHSDSSPPDPKHERQVSKLSFEECCRQRKEGRHRFEEIDTDCEDGDTGVCGCGCWKDSYQPQPECECRSEWSGSDEGASMDGNELSEVPHGEECTDYDTNTHGLEIGSPGDQRIESELGEMEVMDLDFNEPVLQEFSGLYSNLELREIDNNHQNEPIWWASQEGSGEIGLDIYGSLTDDLFDFNDKLYGNTSNDIQEQDDMVGLGFGEELTALNEGDEFMGIDFDEFEDIFSM